MNDITEIDHYPLPLLQDITTMISGSKIFSKIDLKDAFNEIPVIPSQRYLKAFKCKFGVFEYNLMPFGLCNAPLVFQRMIDTVLGPLSGSCCIAYLDDILVFSKDTQAHSKDLEQAFNAYQNIISC